MKQKAIFTNKAVVKSVYDDLKQLFDWACEFRAGYKLNPEASKIYDHRDMYPLSYLVIDVSALPPEKQKEHFTKEFEKMQKAFETLDPETKRPYPESVKPYLKQLFDTAIDTLHSDVNWNDKAAVGKAVRSMVLLQTFSQMYKYFMKEVHELYPTAEERNRIDAGISRAQSLFDRTHNFLRQKYSIDFQSVNELTLIAMPSGYRTDFSEYFPYIASDALLKGKDEIVIDPSVEKILRDFFSGRDVHARQYDVFEETVTDYITEDALADITNGLEDIIKKTVISGRDSGLYGKQQAEHFLIDGKPVTEIIKARNPSNQKDAYNMIATCIRDALTDGKSRVEIARFNYDKDGNAKITYQQLKIDISKLSLSNKTVTNASRDKVLNSAESLILQRRRHVKFEQQYLSTLTPHPTQGTELPKLKWNDEPYQRLEAYETKLASVVSAHLESGKSDKMLEFMLLADENAIDFREPVTADTMAYLENNKADPATIVGNAKLLLEDLAAREGVTPAQLNSVIRSAQKAAFEYMIINPTADAAIDKASHNALVEMYENPEKAFASIMTDDLRKELRGAKSVKDEMQALMSEGKEKMNEARTRARAGENNYQKRVNEINERLAKIKGEVFDANNEAKEKQLFEEQKMLEDGLVQLRDAEIARLEQEYANGRLPKDYFEQRRVDVEQGKHERKLPFGVDERPSFKQFKIDNAIALDGMSSSDVKFAYDNMMESARREETKFILNAMGAQKHIETFAEQIEQISADSLKIPLSITEAKEGLDGPTSPAVTYSDPVADKTLTNN